MRAHLGTVAVCVATLLGLSFAPLASDPPPAWAFPINPTTKVPNEAPTPNKIEHVPGSKQAFTDKQLDDEFFDADWFPSERPVAPQVVEYGRKPSTMACGVCHLASGTGGPAEAALPGLPAAYILEQIGEFRAGRRHGAQPQMKSVHDMEIEARAVSNADVAAAAQYFSQITYVSHYRVIETDIVPKVSVQGVSLYAKIKGGGSEPIGKRIVEVPDDFDRLELGDVHSMFTTYVPKGSVKRGGALAASGDGAAPCRACHGVDLKGVGNIPPLAGRSASYIVRQLYDIAHDTRTGPSVAPMLPEVAHMTPDDRIAIAAYLTSLR